MGDLGSHCCDEMSHHLDDERVGVCYRPHLREYGIRVSGDESAADDTILQLICFCPWCGQRLPESLRDRWFEAIEALRVEPDSSDIPSAMLSDAWWRQPPPPTR